MEEKISKSLATASVLFAATAAISGIVWSQFGTTNDDQSQQPQSRAELGDRRLVSHYLNAGCPDGPFDSDGVIVVDYGTVDGVPIGRQYNPTTISQTAIGCYYNYKRTQLPHYKAIFFDHISWLKKNSVEHGTDSAAYEYKFPWSYGLKSGWRSGLAQGQAISALIRYYYETQDETVLPLIVKLKNYMLLPVEQGGVATTSPEGNLWIEEFPSHPASFVLNGFISSTFGLFEYNKLFPDDKLADRALHDSIESLRASIKHYDAGDWTYLDRRQKPYPKSNDAYAAGYVWQMQTLWLISKDPLFLRTSLRWASFFDDVNLKTDGNMREQGGSYKIFPDLPAGFPNKNLLPDAKIVKSTTGIRGYDIDQLWDRNFDSYFGAARNGPAEFEFKFSRRSTINTLALSLYNVNLYPTDLSIEIRRSGWRSYDKVPYRLATSRRNFVYHFDTPVEATALRIRATQFAGQNRLVIGDLSAGYAQRAGIYPKFGSHTFAPMHLGKGVHQISLSAPPASKDAIFVLYRQASSIEAITSAPWEWRSLDPFGDNRVSSTGGFFQFRVLATEEAAKRGFSNFLVTPPDPED